MILSGLNWLLSRDYDNSKNAFNPLDRYYAIKTYKNLKWLKWRTTFCTATQTACVLLYFKAKNIFTHPILCRHKSLLYSPGYNVIKFLHKQLPSLLWAWFVAIQIVIQFINPTVTDTIYVTILFKVIRTFFNWNLYIF
jgi:hypothetical protein